MTYSSPTFVSPFFIDSLAQNKAAKKINDNDLDLSDDVYAHYNLNSIQSTQQLPIDWSSFENHTFFNSAEANVNTAFDTIVNKFPFDGTKKEVHDFLVGLTGFEKYVYDSFPKNTGFLKFDNSYIEVSDRKNADEIIDKTIPFERVLNPGANSFSIETHIFIPEEVNDNQVICQKIENEDLGFSLVLSESSSIETAQIQFIITSGSSMVFEEFPITKGGFSHICATFDRSPGQNKIYLYQNTELITVSDSVEMLEVSPVSSALTIGTGTTTLQTGFLTTEKFVPQETFSGYLDEFRFFHSKRSIEDQELYGKKTIFANDDLKLYFKFNEPYDYDNSANTTNILLDSSGNSLHSYISNFDVELRNTGSLLLEPISFEDKSFAPVLFPAFEKTINLNTGLLLSASFYDENNPNLITKLVPPHYFLEGQQVIQTDEKGMGTISSASPTLDTPGNGQLGTAQMLTALLLMWGKHFDEIKIVLDHFSNIIHLDYDDKDSALAMFLPFISEYYGFDLPSFFPNATLAQLIEGENIDGNISSSLSLDYIQGQLWKRMLLNLNDVHKSKGTIHSIKSMLRSAGIDTDSLLRIREYGGNAKKDITFSRQQKTEVSTLLDFSGSLSTETPGILSAQGFAPNFPYLTSSWLSGSRTEVGFPEPVGPFTNKEIYYPHGISSFESDGLYTSGSFLVEGIYKFPKQRTYPENQSLMRLCITGTLQPSDTHAVVANIIAVSSSISPEDHELRCYISPTDSTTMTDDSIISLILTGTNIFDGNKWNISVSRHRNDEISSVASSSYSLKCARQSFGEIKEFFTTSSFFYEGADNDMFKTNNDNLNASGSFITIGNQAIAAHDKFLNAAALSSVTRTTEFGGQVGHLRMWSKGFTNNEWKEHVKNYTSLGVVSPFDNFNFNTVATGSFQRLRVDASTDQVSTGTNVSGEIELFDYSQNENHVGCFGFEADTNVIKPETFYFGLISSKFDLLQETNKIRARGMEKEYNADSSKNAIHGLVHELTKQGEFFDDPRFSVEFSSVDALNEDIIKMFSSLDIINDILGAPNNVFADSYQDLEKLREVYFNRLTSKPDLDNYFALFKWFNSTFTQIIEQLLPRKTKYMGTNFIVESHMLERHRFKYLYDDIYLQASERDSSRGNIFLSQITGSIGKF